MVIDSPGSADSLFAGQIAEAASKISPQPVVVEHREDFTNFGTWEGIAWIKDQGELASEGYISYVLTVPDAQVDMAALDIESMTGQTMADLNPVISAERVPYFLIQRADAPWGNTIEELIAYAQANPGAVRHVTGGPGGGQDAAMRFWASALDIPMTDVIGGNPQERALAVASGEGDITASPPDVLGPHYDAERVNLLLGAGGTTFPEPWQDVPPSETLFDGSDPFSQTRTIATSPDVSDEHRDWLYTLFSTAVQDPDYVARREQVHGPSKLIRPRSGRESWARGGVRATSTLDPDLQGPGDLLGRPVKTLPAGGRTGTPRRSSRPSRFRNRTTSSHDRIAPFQTSSWPPSFALVGLIINHSGPPPRSPRGVHAGPPSDPRWPFYILRRA